MPDDKKNQHKGKNDAKEQRKPRQGRQKSAKTTPAVEKKSDEPKVTVPQKPVYQDPGPEFYKNLKRETDEILKITEEANSKYKKKEIQSNWSKYEMPIESYEDIEEQENMGADYEQLVQMPLSVGGHFQFKHEKSWDVSTGPSPYDKYFEINMNDLANAICTIPFYERNNIERDIFSESDMLTMNNRAVKYKQKYFNDKSYTTTDLTAIDKTLNSFKEAFSETKLDDREKTDDCRDEKTSENESPVDISVDSKAIELQFENKILDNISSGIRCVTPAKQQVQEEKVKEVIDEIDDLILEDTSPPARDEHVSTIAKMEASSPPASIAVVPSKINEQCILDSMDNTQKGDKPESVNTDPAKNPVIESPEDLEKWLDDFLDG